MLSVHVAQIEFLKSFLSLIVIQIHVVVYTYCISTMVNKILLSVDNLTLTSFFVPSFSIRSNTSSNGILGKRRWAQCSKYRMMICRSLACNNTNQPDYNQLPIYHVVIFYCLKSFMSCCQLQRSSWIPTTLF